MSEDNDPDDRPASTYRSNGSILSDMGQTSIRAERERQEQKESLEIRLRDWKSLETILRTLIKALDGLPRDSAKDAYAFLTRVYATITPTLTAPPKGSSTYLRYLRNEIVSTREALATGAYTKSALRRLELEWPQQALDKTVHLIRRAERKLQQLDQETPEELDPLDSMLETLEEVNGDSRKLALLSKAENGYLMVRVPLVVIGAPVSALVKNKIPHKNLGGYAALLNQRVIGVRGSLIERDKKGRAKETIKDVAERLLAALAPSVGRLSIINPHTPTFAGGVWFWVSAEDEINTLRRALGPSLISPWGFCTVNEVRA